MTPRQLQALNAIKAYWAEHGIGPSLKDLGDTLGISAGNVWQLVQRLESRGLVTRTPREIRSLRVVDQGVKCPKCHHVFDPNTPEETEHDCRPEEGTDDL